MLHTHRSHTNITKALQRTSKMVSSHRFINEQKKDSEILGILPKHYQSNLMLTICRIKDASHYTIPTPFRPVHLQIERAYEIQVNLGVLSKSRISLYVVRFSTYIWKHLSNFHSNLHRLIAFCYHDTYGNNTL